MMVTNPPVINISLKTRPSSWLPRPYRGLAPQPLQRRIDIPRRCRSVFSTTSLGGFAGTAMVAFAALLFAAACSQPPVPAPGILSTDEWRRFEGTWSASGTRQTLNLETNHRASIFDLTGSLILTGDHGLGVGFQARAIGFTDNLTGMQGECVWTDDRGDHLYSELKGEFVEAGNHIVGTFRGGTGRYAGVTGEYSFQWKYVAESEDGTVSGRAVELKGRARLSSTAAAVGGEPIK
jgi:hypothetical protein